MPRKRRTQRGTAKRPSKHERILQRAMRDMQRASRDLRTPEAIRQAPKRSDIASPCNPDRLMSKGARGVTSSPRGMLAMPNGGSERMPQRVKPSGNRQALKLALMGKD